MKKIISILTAGTLCLTMGSASVFAAQFTDIEDEKYSWAKPYIEDMADKGYITGYEDGTFQPDKEVSKLEGIAMFARSMGVKDEANAVALQKARDTYDELLLQYSLSWGQDELAYLLYKGVFDTSDLNTYIMDVKNEPMKRYEAAIIITKAMYGEEEALENAGVVLDYADAKEIPTNALGYVAYASEQGIMNGMDDGSFSPFTPVSRAQMAVMLARVAQKTGYEYIQAKLVSIDTETQTLILRNATGDEIEYSYTDETAFAIMGSAVKAEYMIENVAVTCALKDDVVASIDSHTGESDTVVTGKYQGSMTSNGRVRIKIIPNGKTSVETYFCAEDVSVTYEGKPATMRSFVSGDVITLELSAGEIYAISGKQQEYEIQGATIESINTDDATITISHPSDEYNGQKLIVSSNATVKKNGVAADFSQLYPGDSATITMHYGEVIKVVATSTTKVYEGIVKSVIQDEQVSMVVTVNGVEHTYVVANDVPVTKDGVAATIFDIRRNDTVKITTESQAITKIVCVGSQIYEDGKISGTITTINVSMGFVKIVTPAGAEETIFCSDNKTAIVNTLGAKKLVKNLQDGNKITAYGTVSSGAFMSTLIVIEK